MIEKLQIKNFQKHTKLNIEFDKCVTTIVGPSNRGKSSVLRALRWTVQNKPAGADFIKENTGQAAARIFIDGHIIARIKGKKNIYKLDKQLLSAFGTNVPENIASLLNISDINFQQQHDKPFWFSETSGEVSRQLNKIINLEVIDSTLSKLDSMKRDSKQKTIIIQKRITNYKEQAKGLLKYKEMDDKLGKLEAQQTAIDKISHKATLLADMIKKAQRYSATKKRCKNLVSIGKTAIEAGDDCLDIQSRLNTLKYLISEGQKQHDIIANKPPSIKYLQKLKEKTDNIVSKVKRLEELLEIVVRHKDRKNKALAIILGKTQEIKKVIGKRCPLCQSPIQSQ